MENIIFFWCVVVLVLITPYGSGLRVPLTEDFIEAPATVTFEHSYGDRSKREVSQLPEGSKIRIALDGTVVQLDLVRNYHLDVHIPVFVRRDGRIEQVQYPKTQESALYQDRKSGGAFLLEPPIPGSSKSKIFGTFHHNSSHFLIQPVEGDLDIEGEGHGKDHVASRIPDTELVFDSIQPAGPRDYLSGKISSRHGFSRGRRQTNVYNIELLAVVDYEKYLFWYDRAASSVDRRTEALRLIREYMAFMMNAIDVRYKSITTFDVNIRSAGVYVANTTTDSPFTSNRVVGGTVDGSTTLEAFTKWLRDQTGLPQYDHAMAFTRHNVSSSTGDSAGIAFVGSLCSSQSTSLVEDSLNFVTMTTAAHELGHSLGAQHDGASNLCSSTDNYIMAPTNRITSSNLQGQRLWQFSTCSMGYFQNYIYTLNRQGSNCMLTNHPNAQVVTTHRPMAEVFPADQTCVNNFGTGSAVCRFIQNYADMCTNMYCSDPGTSTCYSVIPAEGTPCGQGKWCERGHCVTSPNAPSDVTDTCPIGDRPGIFEDGLTCSEYVSRNLYACYGAYTEANCCESCKRQKVGIPNCQYGDKATGCQQSQCPWYVDATRALCCSTCYTGTTLAPPTTARPTTARPTTAQPTTARPTTARATTTRPTTANPSVTDRPTTAQPITQQPTTDRPTTGNPNTDSPQTTPTDTNPDAQESGPSMVVIAGGIAAGAVVVVVAIVIVCVVRRKGADGPVFVTYDNPGFITPHGKPSHPPPRRTVSGSYPPPTPTKAPHQAGTNTDMDISTVGNSVPAYGNTAPYTPSSPNDFNYQQQQHQQQHKPTPPAPPMKPAKGFVGELQTIQNNSTSPSANLYQNNQFNFNTPNGNASNSHNGALNNVTNALYDPNNSSTVNHGINSVGKQPIKPILPIKPKNKQTGIDNKAFAGDRPDPPKRPVPRRQTLNNDVS